MEQRKTSRETKGRSNWQGWLGPLLLIVLVCIVLQSMLSSGSQRDMEYGVFKQHVRDGYVQSVKISKSQITGKLTEEGAKAIQTAKAGKEGASPEVEFRVPRVGVENDTNLIPLLEEKAVQIAADEEQSQVRIVLSWFLPLILLILFLYFLLFRRLGPGGGALTFGRSRAKLYAQDDLHITFEDVAGIEEPVEELREVVDFLKTPQKYQAVGGRIPKGVLLVGPPGTGKTLLAKAVAGEANVAFFGLSGSDFVEMFVGVGAARVRDLFAQAEERAPCIIFIDELDALGKVRGNGIMGGHDEREQTLNQLLVEMDGFDSNRGVIIMAATNRPETLDPALLRPGRFDRTVVVHQPDVTGREAILKVHVRNVKVADELDLRKIASLTAGFVGADLANLVNEAALLAAREDKPHVTMKHIEEAIERGVAGLKRKRPLMSIEGQRSIAYHECGHAIVRYLLPGADPVHKISIIPRGPRALGYVLHLPVDDRYVTTQAQLEIEIASALGGVASEEMIYGDASTGNQSDLVAATNLARRMVTEFGMSRKIGWINCSESDHSAFLRGAGLPSDRDHSEATAALIDQEVKRIVDKAAELARTILRDNRQALEKLTQRLIEKEVMDAEELKAIMDESGPRIVPGTMPEGSTRPAGESSASKDAESAAAKA